MKGRRKICFGLTAVLLLTLSACGGPGGEPAAPTQTPRPTAAPREEAGAGFVLPCYPAGGFHPITGTNRLNLTLAPLMYRGLFSVGRDFQAEEELCASYTVSEDGLVWTFWLADVEFSDGSPLTAQEVARSLNAARVSERYAGRLKDVQRIGAEGETVVVTLGRPNGALPLLLDIPIVKEGEEGRPLGTGAYFLTEDEEGLALTARPEARVPAERIPLRSVGAGDDLVYAFDAREISLVDTDLTGTNVLGYSGLLETTDYPTTTLLYLGCNLGSGLCREQEVRQAVALALDRGTMAGRTLAGHGVASSLPVHPNAPGYDEELAGQWGQDPEKAAALLTEAGWSRDEEGKLTRKRGERLELRLVVNQDNTFKVAMAEAAAGPLEELGFTVTLERLAWEEFVIALERGEFDLYLGETTLTPDFDLTALLGRDGDLNYGRFADEETWTLMELNRAARGDERVTTTVNLCGRVAELAPIIPLCFKNGSLLTQWGQVSGAAPTQRDVFAGLENWRISSGS